MQMILIVGGEFIHANLGVIGDECMYIHIAVEFEGEKKHKKGGLNCVFENFFFYVLDNCPQVQSLK